METYHNIWQDDSFESIVSCWKIYGPLANDGGPEGMQLII
jgi:hypothetical protein